MRTDDLIAAIVTAARPVRPLPTPWVRAAGWLAAGGVWLAFALSVLGPRADLTHRLGEPTFDLELAAILATAVAAAIAAFASAVPGLDRRLSLLPLPPLALWLLTLGESCRAAWLADGGFGGRLAPDWSCVPAVALLLSVPTVLMLSMIGRRYPLRTRRTALLGALAAASLASFGLKLFHDHDVSLFVLVWQLAGLALASLILWFAPARRAPAPFTPM